MKRCVVIGAGVGGLSAAIYLARAGIPVLVLEASDSIGGKANVAIVDGVEFDTGPSLLTLPDVFFDVLGSAAVHLGDLLISHRGPLFRYLYDDGVCLDVHSKLDATVREIRTALGADAAMEFEAFLTYAGRIWTHAAPSFVFGSPPTAASVLRGGPRNLLKILQVDPFRSMRSSIETWTASPHLRALCMRYATYTGSDVRTAPATLNCIAHVEHAIGGFGVRGGMYELIRALHRTALALGVEFEVSNPVTAIRVASGSVCSIETERGQSAPCDAAVVNADVGILGRLIAPSSALRTRGHPEPSMSAWTGVIRARRRVGRAARIPHTVVFPRDYNREFEDIFDHRRMPEDPTIYVCAQEACHERTGWRDHEPLFVMVNAPAEPSIDTPGREWSYTKNAVFAKLVERGLVDSDDAWVWERSPRDLSLRFPGSRGALYGAASNSRFSAFMRPPNRHPSVRGLYLASGSAHPGGGLSLCALSGKGAASALIDDFGGCSTSVRESC